MLLELGFTSPLLIPQDVDVAREVCDAYETACRTLDQEAARAAKLAIGAQQACEAADIAVRLWRHASHDTGMRPAEGG